MNQKVLIIEDFYDLALLQKDLINNIEGFCCEDLFLNPKEYLSSSCEADIILLDLVTPEMGGIEAIPEILKKAPHVAIIINSVKDNTDVILQALRLGAVGYIDKQNFIEYIEEVLKSVSNGGAFMTPKIAKKVFDFFSFQGKVLNELTKRELDVSMGIIDGLSYKLIADKYNISIDTVKMNIRNIYKKLNISNKAELIFLVTGNK